MELFLEVGPASVPLSTFAVPLPSDILGYHEHLAVTAGDVNHITIGHNSNIQDNVVVHVAKHNASNTELPTTIGNNVTIGMYCCFWFLLWCSKLWSKLAAHSLDASTL